MAGVNSSSKSIRRRGPTVLRIVVAGEPQTGKSSLIHAAAGYQIGTKVHRHHHLLPPPSSDDGVPITLIDTSSRFEDGDKVNKELKQADSIILTYACDQPQTLRSLTSSWLPRLRRLHVKVPVIVVGCKLDLQDENQEISVESMILPLMQRFSEIEEYTECSAYSSLLVSDVVFLAQKAALYPTSPLFDKESKTLKLSCARALKRIFILCDRDRDGALSDDELNNLQVKCFNAPLQPHDILDVKMLVQSNLSEGVNERGLTLTGFLFLHARFIEGLIWTTWTVLRKFGYNDDMKLDDDFIPRLKRAPDQSVELTIQAIDFLVDIFDEFDGDSDKVLQPRELEELFSLALESPWIENPYKDAVERNAFGGLSLDAFLSEWALMTLLNPTFSVTNLKYMGYPGDPSSAIRVTRRRHVDRKKQRSERNVLQCFIFGPMEAGKSALLNSFIGRPYSEVYNPTNEDRYAVNVVDISTDNKKYLVLREISEAGAKKLLANKESLASCDIAVFVHERSDESSWKASCELLSKIVGHGEETGFEVPCLIVAAKEEQDSFTMAIQDATVVNQDMEVEAPMPINMKLEDFNSIFRRIVTAAENPHLSIPETEAGKTRKQFRRLRDQSLMFVSVGLGVAMAVMFGAAKKNGAARKNASG